MILLNNDKWGILLVPSNHPVLCRPDGTLSVARCDDDKKVIYISNILKDEYLRKVLCHEITHAVICSYNIKVGMYHEEMIADLIASHGEEILYNTQEYFDKINWGFL